jgi:hypothetical protein
MVLPLLPLEFFRHYWQYAAGGFSEFRGARSRRAGQALAAPPGGLRSGSFKPARPRPETPADAALKSSMAALRYQPP